MADIQLSQDQPDRDPPPEQRQRKRRRRTMACMQCRSRKLRCDREYPTCGRCLKSKTPTKCTYEDGFLWQQPNTVASTVFSDRGSTGIVPIMPPQSDRTPVHTPPDSGIRAPPRGPDPPWAQRPHIQKRPQEEKRKDHFLETVLGAPKAAVNQEPYVNSELLLRSRRTADNRDASPDKESEDGMASPSQELNLSPRIMMRGKETKTRFNGSGILANLMAQFLDLKPFAEEIRLASPHLAQLRPDLERVKKGLWKRKPLNEPFPLPDTASLIGLLPTRAVVDELVILYLTYIESTLRILHVPSFLRELEEFWAARDNPDLASSAFVVQLLLVLANAWNLADFDTINFKNDIPLKCYSAVEWILHTEKWLQNAQIKRPEITSLRLYVLLIQAQNAFGMKRSKAWLSTGTLIKQAMLAGYHRDPGRYAKISVFNKEMRRRIWTTIVELDLQVSLDRGMPPQVHYSDYDCQPSSNINDADVQETTAEMPESKPLDEVTDCSFQTILSQSLPLRLKICHLMHSPRITCRYDEILRLDWELNRHLSKIPSWPTADTDDYQTQHKVALLKASLETKIGHALLTLHTPFAIEAVKEPVFAPSARARLEVATLILSTQRRLHEMSRQLSLCLLGDWTIQACCSVCQLLHGGSDPRAPSTFLNRTLPGFSESLLTLVETILVCLETRLLLVVKGAKEYFFISAILSLAKAKLWPAQASIYKQEVVDRVIIFAQALFSRHANCAHLGDPGMGNFKNNQVIGLTPGAGLAPPLAPNLNGMLQPTNFGVTPPGEFDPFLDVFDWEDLTGIAFGE